MQGIVATNSVESNNFFDAKSGFVYNVGDTTDYLSRKAGCGD